jgi:hypothetical protein
LLNSVLGAVPVECVECDPTIASMSEQIARANEVELTVQSKISTSLPSTKTIHDILVTEIFDCGLLGEGAVDTILDAKKRAFKSEIYRLS